jgi:hypothetical protein
MVYALPAMSQSLRRSKWGVVSMPNPVGIGYSRERLEQRDLRMPDTFDLEELARIAYDQLGLQSKEIVEVALTRQIASKEAYLKRRAARGTHTPTDKMEADNCALAALLIKVVRGEIVLK